MFDYLWAIWIIAGLVLLIFEIFTPGFVVSLIGISSILTGVLAIFIKNIIIQIIVFSISLLLLMIYIRPIFLKYLVKKDAKKSNIDALIGKNCIVETTIDNLKDEGYIKVGADYWKAKSINGSIIPKGSIVRIEKMEGITAFVNLINK